MMLDKKQVWSVFLFKFKMSHKTAETLTTSTMHLAQKLTNTQYSGGSRSFTKETKALKLSSGLPSTVDNHQEPSSKLWKNSTLTILWLFSIEANWKGKKAP